MSLFPIRLTRNRRLLLLAILVVAGGSFLAGMLSFRRWEGRQYFGEVARMTGSGFVIADLKAAERMIEVDSSTVIKRGSRTVGSAESVNVGERVMIVGNEESGTVRAKLIRIVGGSGNGMPR